MKITVYVAATLRTFVDKRSKIVAEGRSVREVIQNIGDEYPDSRKGLFDENVRLRQFVSVYVNDSRVREEDWSKPINENDTVLLLPAIAGGAPTESVISDERRKEVTLRNYHKICSERFGGGYKKRDNR